MQKTIENRRCGLPETSEEAMRTEKLIRVTKAHAEAMYQIALDKLQRERKAHACTKYKKAIKEKQRG